MWKLDEPDVNSAITAVVTSTTGDFGYSVEMLAKEKAMRAELDALARSPAEPQPAVENKHAGNIDEAQLDRLLTHSQSKNPMRARGQRSHSFPWHGPRGEGGATMSTYGRRETPPALRIHGREEVRGF